MRKMLILLVALCCCGCGEDFSKSMHLPTAEVIGFPHTEVNHYVNAVGPDINVIEIEGHLYLVFSGNHNGGIIHAEHCPCKTK